jgi:hypothetical protein
MNDTRRNFARVAGASGLAVDASVLDVRDTPSGLRRREVTPAADILVKTDVSKAAPGSLAATAPGHLAKATMVATMGRSMRRFAVAGLMASGCPQRTTAHAQSIEPARTERTVGMNFLIAGFIQHRRPRVRRLAASATHLKTTSAVIAYARAFGLAGMSGKFDVVLPTPTCRVCAPRGSPIQRQATGLSDAGIRLSLNFYGAPALSLPEFKSYEQDLIVGGASRCRRRPATTTRGSSTSAPTGGTSSLNWAFRRQWARGSWRPQPA